MIDELLTGEIQLEVESEYREGARSNRITGRPIAIRALWRGREVGVLDVSIGSAIDKALSDYWVISYVEVDAAFRRKGVSAKMRAEALRITCAAGKKLVSDVVRSGFEEAFWADLHARGEVDVLYLRSGTLRGVEDDEDDELMAEPSEDELMAEQDNYDFVYVMRCAA